MVICKVKNCQNEVLAKGLCNKHYQQLWKYGKVLERTKRDDNKIIEYKDYVEICLYNIKSEEVARTKIDKDDLEKVSKYKWCLNSDYVRTDIDNKAVRLHHFIIGKKQGYEVDHKNTDKLDNRKKNLRFVTRSQNMMNKKNSKGVGWHKRDKRWQAYIKINQKNIYLGSFKNKENAIEVRKKAEKKYFKEFTYGN